LVPHESESSEKSYDISKIVIIDELQSKCLDFTMTRTRDIILLVHLIQVFRLIRCFRSMANVASIQREEDARDP